MHFLTMITTFLLISGLMNVPIVCTASVSTEVRYSTSNPSRVGAGDVESGDAVGTTRDVSSDAPQADAEYRLTRRQLTAPIIRTNETLISSRSYGSMATTKVVKLAARTRSEALTGTPQSHAAQIAASPSPCLACLGIPFPIPISKSIGIAAKTHSSTPTAEPITEATTRTSPRSPLLSPPLTGLLPISLPHPSSSRDTITPSSVDGASPRPETLSIISPDFQNRPMVTTASITSPVPAAAATGTFINAHSVDASSSPVGVSAFPKPNATSIDSSASVPTSTLPSTTSPTFRAVPSTRSSGNAPRVTFAMDWVLLIPATVALYGIHGL